MREMACIHLIVDTLRIPFDGDFKNSSDVKQFIYQNYIRSYNFIGLTVNDENIGTIYERVIANIEALIKIDHFNKDYLEEKQ